MFIVLGRLKAGVRVIQWKWSWGWSGVSKKKQKTKNVLVCNIVPAQQPLRGVALCGANDSFSQADLFQ